MTNDIDLGMMVYSPDWMKKHRVEVFAHLLAYDFGGADGGMKDVPI